MNEGKCKRKANRKICLLSTSGTEDVTGIRARRFRFQRPLYDSKIPFNFKCKNVEAGQIEGIFDFEISYKHTK